MGDYEIGTKQVVIAGSPLTVVYGNYDQTLNIAQLSGVMFVATPPPKTIWRVKSLSVNVPVQTGASQFEINFGPKAPTEVIKNVKSTQNGTAGLTIDAFTGPAGTTPANLSDGILATVGTSDTPIALYIFNNTGSSITGAMRWRMVVEQEVTL